MSFIVSNATNNNSNCNTWQQLYLRVLSGAVRPIFPPDNKGLQVVHWNSFSYIQLF